MAIVTRCVKHARKFTISTNFVSYGKRQARRQDRKEANRFTRTGQFDRIHSRPRFTGRDII